MDMQSAVGTAAQQFKMMFKGMTDEMQACIQHCAQCHQVCLQMIQHCLTKGGAHADPRHIKLLQDCAQICQTSADFMIRGSDLHGKTCAACAEACIACAVSCEAMADDEMMKMCAEVCRSCAESCQKMAAQH